MLCPCDRTYDLQKELDCGAPLLHGELELCRQGKEFDYGCVNKLLDKYKENRDKSNCKELMEAYKKTLH